MEKHKKHYLDKTPEERREHLLTIGKPATWPAAGIIFCESCQLYCARVDLKTGICTAEACNITEPSFIAKEKAMERKRQELHDRSTAEKENSKSDSRPRIRTQNKTKGELIDNRISQLRDLITQHYKYARPHKAVLLELEVRRLEQERREYDEWKM